MLQPPANQSSMNFVELWFVGGFFVSYKEAMTSSLSRGEVKFMAELKIFSMDEVDAEEVEWL